MRAYLLCTVIAIAGCGGAPPTPLPAPPPVAPVEPPLEPVEKPPNYVEVHAKQVVDTGGGAAVLLLDEATNLIIPIYIGGTEGMSIGLRIRGEVAPRPLTHDLMDAAIKKLKGSIVKVHVDELREGTFHGSVYIRSGRRLLRLDARPSDAIALAIGNRAPIYVAQQVLDEAGVQRDELLRQLGVTPDAP
jgi:bifunctional DNase/RNase